MRLGRLDDLDPVAADCALESCPGALVALADLDIGTGAKRTSSGAHVDILSRL
ncbi:hypothetical protein ACFC8F_23075 [Streptomyces hydrogenans]|uniref:hypothetical protein n=1 Tax=Streptomyces hydrogenans TaxID=1873719 RepID=UPI0035D5A24C